MKLLMPCLVCLVIGYAAANVKETLVPSMPGRPVARLFQRLARLGLWVAVFAEPAPQPVERQYASLHGDESTMVCHAEGW